MPSRFKFTKQSSRTSSYLVLDRQTGYCYGELWKDRDGAWLGISASGQHISYPGSRDTAAGILSRATKGHAS